MALRLDWDSLIADWDFDYQANLIKFPYSGEIHLSTPTNMCSISGTIQTLTLGCDEDFVMITNWFDRGYQYVRCPLFFRAPISYEGTRSYLDPGLQLLRWQRTNAGSSVLEDSPYCYDTKCLYFTGVNSNGGLALDPNQPIEWYLKIRPVERGFEYIKKKKNIPGIISPIPFVAVPVFDDSNNLIDPF
jgi:hypothetical protein